MESSDDVDGVAKCDVDEDDDDRGSGRGSSGSGAGSRESGGARLGMVWRMSGDAVITRTSDRRAECMTELNLL